jgi:folylpolyglutamate synthase/dihydrofolate synthase
MTAKWLADDEPFFREYNARDRSQKRSLPRARQLLRLLHPDPIEIPIVTVVGSKGKGTAATCAAAVLSSAGLRVGLITSPPFRTNRERIRIDGRAIDAGTYRHLSHRLSGAIDNLRPLSSDDGYLSPTGCFTVTGMAHLLDAGYDAIVLEEGLGGCSDEISLFAPTVLVVTPIFLEHADLLGDDETAIAHDLLGVAHTQTQLIASTGQEPKISAVLETKASEVGAELVFVRDGLEEWLEHTRALSRDNARVGAFAGTALTSKAWPERNPKPAVMDTVAWPGRLTDYSDGDRHWVVDAAIDPRGAAAALEWCRRNMGEPALVVLCLPDIKDAEGVLRVFTGLPLIGVRVGESYLSYDTDLWPEPLVSWDEALATVHSHSGVILAVGTISFVGEALDHLDVDCERTYAV